MSKFIAPTFTFVCKNHFNSNCLLERMWEPERPAPALDKQLSSVFEPQDVKKSFLWIHVQHVLGVFWVWCVSVPGWSFRPGSGGLIELLIFLSWIPTSQADTGKCHVRLHIHTRIYICTEEIFGEGDTNVWYLFKIFKGKFSLYPYRPSIIGVILL